jgi:hypothetical protein
MDKTATTIRIWKITRELLRRIRRIRYRSPAQQIHVWAEEEAQRLGLMDPHVNCQLPSTANVLGDARQPTAAVVGRGSPVHDRDGQACEAPVPEGRGPRCGDDLLVYRLAGDRACRRPGCGYYRRDS